MAARFTRSAGESIRSFGLLFAVGVSFVLAIIIGAAAGFVLDRWLGTSPWLFLIFFFLGLAAGILNVFRTAGKYPK